MPKTWESLWQPLLAQASRLAGEGLIADEPLGAAAGSIILSRTAWDAFVAEFIEWRCLSPNIKSMVIDEAISRIHIDLGLPVPTFRKGSVWRSLQRLNQIRNALVHHKANPMSPSDLPGSWFRELVGSGVIAHHKNRTWELSVCSPRVAKWSCEVVAEGIIELEAIPTKRRRSIRSVRAGVGAALGRNSIEE